MSAVPDTVRLTRSRHPFEGRQLPVLGSMRRHRVCELLVVLPDGSKRLVPASWTDLESEPAGDSGNAPGTLGLVADLLGLSVLVSALCAGSAGSAVQAARKSPCKEDDRAACSAQSAAGPGSGATPALTGHLPAVQVEVALVLLARLIAKAAGPTAGAEDGDE